MKSINLAIVGATGMVGQAFLKVLEERNFPINNLYLLASRLSTGKKIIFKNKIYTVEELKQTSFERNIDIALFSAGSSISKVYAPIAAASGCTVIDNSSQWRMHDEVPLVVPEVNYKDIFTNRGIIANPNCSTIQAVVVLHPLNVKYKINRIIYSTYQAVSGAGMKGVNDLLSKSNTDLKKFPHQIYNNCIPHIDEFLPNGYTKEEIKMVNETRKILHDSELKITATAVRVPVIYGHCESINVELESKFELEDVINLLKNSKGIVVLNNSLNNEYPMPINCVDSDEVYVGRIRRDLSVNNGLNLWVVANNVRKGAASNAVQIAECIIDA